ncbi:unnamed protein product [Allacma fusca]|uniref:Transmembrane protein n=1 Tax=Allacma fusca TaxID=39272 RepID=A0A8J2JUA6_9HEXA|nr:unnamed protein product [Allacma fusca]
MARSTKLLGIEFEKWTHFIATFQLLLSILFVFQSLPRLGLLPFSYSQVLEEISDVKNGDLELISAIILMSLNLVGGAMAMILEDGLREKNPMYLRKWVRFSIFSLFGTILVDVIRLQWNGTLDMHHGLGMGIFIFIQSFCIFAVKVQEIDMMDKSKAEDIFEDMKV